MGIQDARKKCIFYSGYICSVVLSKKYSLLQPEKITWFYPAKTNVDKQASVY